MNLSTFHRLVLDPPLSALGAPYDRPEARGLLLAIALHESNLEHRVQRKKGGGELPHLARGFWQFEEAGVRAALGHPRNGWLRTLLPAFALPVEPKRLHTAVAYSEIAMVLLARALLWPHPQALPRVDIAAVEEAYAYYLACWRPGKRRPEDWREDWAASVRFLHAAAIG